MVNLSVRQSVCLDKHSISYIIHDSTKNIACLLASKRQTQITLVLLANYCRLIHNVYYGHFFTSPCINHFERLTKQIIRRPRLQQIISKLSYQAFQAISLMYKRRHSF